MDNFDLKKYLAEGRLFEEENEEKKKVAKKKVKKESVDSKLAEIEKEAKTWWAKTMKGRDSWDNEDMDIFIDYLMDKGLVDPNSDELSDTIEELESYVENVLGYELCRC